MLEKMYGLFTGKFINPLKAWDKLIEFLIVDNQGRYFFQIDHKFEWLWEDQKMVNQLMTIYDSELLRSDCNDHIGMFYYQQVLCKTYPDNPFVGKILHQKGITYSSTGTGNELMQAAKKNPDIKYYGVEPDVKLYRIALTNCMIYDIKAKLLNANPGKHDIDLKSSEGKSNWQYANQWNVDQNILKPSLTK